MHVFACLLLCFISFLTHLDLVFATLCALSGLVLIRLWGYLLVWLHLSLLWLIGMWPLLRYISVMLVCLMHTLSLLRSMVCLPCLLCATRLALIVSFHLCTLAYMFMHESLCLLVSSSLIPTISCRFTPVFDTQDPNYLLGILLDGTCVVHTPIQ